MSYFSDLGLNVTIGEMQEEQQMDAMDLTMSERTVIDRYTRLAAVAKPDCCFTCNRKRPLVNALVQGPDEQRVTGKATAGRGHGVCRPCIKAGEATALR